MVAAKISFLSKFYPDAHSSPGGNIRIVRNKMKTDGYSDGVTGETVEEPLDPETQFRNSNKKHLPISKRKSEISIRGNHVRRLVRG